MKIKAEILLIALLSYMATTSLYSIGKIDDKVYTASHLFSTSSVYRNKDTDLLIVKASKLLKLSDLNEVYVPSLGNVKMLKYSKDYLIIDAAGKVFEGLSGVRVLTVDKVFDLGFISRIENGEVYVVRTLDF